MYGGYLLVRERAIDKIGEVFGASAGPVTLKIPRHNGDAARGEPGWHELHQHSFAPPPDTPRASFVSMKFLD